MSEIRYLILELADSVIAIQDTARDVSLSKEQLSKEQDHFSKEHRYVLDGLKPVNSVEVQLIKLEKYRFEMEVKQMGWDRKKQSINDLEDRAKVDLLHVLQNIEKGMVLLEKALSEKEDERSLGVQILLVDSILGFLLRSSGSIYGLYLGEFNRLKSEFESRITSKYAGLLTDFSESVVNDFKESCDGLQSYHDGIKGFLEKNSLDHLKQSQWSGAQIEMELSLATEARNELKLMLKGIVGFLKKTTSMKNGDYDTLLYRFAKISGSIPIEMLERGKVVFEFGQEGGALYKECEKVLLLKDQALAKIKDGLNREKALVDKVNQMVVEGNVIQAESVIRRLTFLYSDLDYSELRKKVADRNTETQTLGDLLDKIQMVLADSRKWSIFSIFKTRRSLFRILKESKAELDRFQGKALTDYEKKYLHAIESSLARVKDQLFFLKKGKRIAMIGIGVFTCFLMFDALIDGYRSGVEKQTGISVHGLESIPMEIYRGDHVEALMLDENGERWFPLSSNNTEIRLQIEYFGELILPVTIEKGKRTDITADVRDEINLQGKTNLRNVLAEKTRRYILLKHQLLDLASELNTVNELKDPAMKALSEYQETFTDYTEKKMIEYRKEKRFEVVDIKRELTVQSRNKENVSVRLMKMQDTAVGLINKYLMQNALRIPIVPEQEKALIFETDYVDLEPGGKTIKLVVGEYNFSEDTYRNVFVEEDESPLFQKNKTYLFLRNFPEVIEDKFLREEVLALYENWVSYKAKNEDAEDLLNARLFLIESEISDKEEKYREYLNLIEPLQKKLEESLQMERRIIDTRRGLNDEVIALNQEIKKLDGYLKNITGFSRL